MSLSQHQTKLIFINVIQHVYPLLYLLLKYHARIVKLACHHIIDLSEMEHWTESLDSLIIVVKQRVETLGGTLWHIHR